ncbi:NnrU family protein [Sphingomonas sp. Y38-1Y]|uniref:NnrU family protein n=1 Tax=Sphingomonas sp. Y38-1Y TaxID=3078265 RepID=UPI0028F0A892|nr:NnrU family protein [Sphingomonas sp. Y38-1Y]
MPQLVFAVAAFVGTHFLLSHPLRAPVVGRIGERGFMGVYSLVAFAALGWVYLAWKGVPEQPPLWPVGDGLWALATAIMLVASVLLVGSLIGNPALPDPDAGSKPVPIARGVYAVTRHPMLWAFALWAGVHILVYPVLAQIVLAVGIAILSLVGAALQDRKKEALQPDRWREWEARTSYWPFAAIAAGRARFGGFRPHDWAGGAVVWLAATWAHMPLAGWPAGIWRWVS